MGLLHPESLATTVDAVSEALFLAWPLKAAERAEAARWIAERQGLPGAYAGMYAPTDLDYQQGLRLFTGERRRSGGGLAHVLGEEAGRVLRLLRSPQAAVRDALQRADTSMGERLARSDYPESGRYCCYTCSVAVWRHLAAGGLGGAEDLLAVEVRSLRGCRDGTGRWRGFPFWYTVLALHDMDLPAAGEELHYAARALERAARGRAGADQYAARRRALTERVLNRG
jgi:hypothetical protein